MGRKQIVMGVVAAAALLAGATAQAEVSLGAKVGTLGIGGEVSAAISPQFVGRVDYNAYNYGTSGTEGGVPYNLDLELETVGAYLDWHPGGGGFRVTGGYVMNNNQIKLTSKTGLVIVGNNLYLGADLRGTAKFSNGYYVGIGWGNALAAGKGFSFTADLGVLYQGAPTVSLVDRNGVVSAADLRQEEIDAESSLHNYRYYPVVSAGLAYRF